MSHTDYRRKPRRFSNHWRLRDRPSPRPVVPERVAIAEQLAAMDLADFAVPSEETTEAVEDDALAPWELELLAGTRSIYLGSPFSGPDEDEPDCGTGDDEQDWMGPHRQDFSTAHTLECEDCAQDYAEMYEPSLVSSLDAVGNDEGADGEETECWLPLLTYRQAVAELGDGFTITGPNVVGDATTSQHYIRVYELARVCDLPSHAVVALLRLQDQWVLNHLSLLARPAANDFLAAVGIHGDLDDLIEKTRPVAAWEQYAQLSA